MVDVADSKSAGGNSVRVRVPPPAPNSYKSEPSTNRRGFGFIIFMIFPGFNSKMQIPNQHHHVRFEKIVHSIVHSKDIQTGK